MSGKACLSNAELELTQRIQMHFPRGVIPVEALKRWNSCSKELLTKRLAGVFSQYPPRAAARSNYLRLISGDEGITIDATDGKETFMNTSDVLIEFTTILKENKWKLDGESVQPTTETLVDVYELHKDATHEQIFCSLPPSYEELCLTEAQIIGFIRKHRGWLRTGGYSTLCLFELGQYLVVSIHLSSRGDPEIMIYPLNHMWLCHADARPRVIIPRSK